MVIIDANDLLRMLRKKMQLTRAQMLEILSIDEKTLRLLEGNKTSPRTSTVVQYPEMAESVPAVIFSYLQKQPVETYELCEKLEVAFDIGNIESAEKLYEQIESCSGMSDLLNRQYCLMQKVRLILMKEKNGNRVLPLVKEAMQITNLDPENFMGEPLLHHETQLLLTLAQATAAMGYAADAIDLLLRINTGVKAFPYDERTQIRIRLPALLTLAVLQHETGDFNSAIPTCNEGIEASVKWSHGKQYPDFLLIKTLAMHALGITGDIINEIAMIYAGYLSLQNTEKVHNILLIARDVFGICLKTHEMEGIPPFTTPMRITGEKMPSGMPINHIGEMIRILREFSCLSQKDLCEGLCHFATLSKIESGNTEAPDIFLIEALTQRLGVDTTNYCNFYVPHHEFVGYNMRNRVLSLLQHGEYDNAELLLDKLEKRKGFDIGLRLQFIEFSRVVLFNRTQNRGNAENIETIQRALRLTVPRFDENNIVQFRLSMNEASLVNLLGNYYLRNNELQKAENVYRQLLANITTKWRNETLLVKLFATVSFNYSTCLGRMEAKEEALFVAERALEFAQRHRQLSMIGKLAFNYAYCQAFQHNKKKESLQWFVLSYYMFALFSNYGSKNKADTVRQIILNEFQVEL